MTTTMGECVPVTDISDMPSSLSSPFTRTHTTRSLLSRFSAYLEEEAEADPLVVFMISPLVRIEGLIDAGMGDVETDSLPKGARNRVRRVDPAVGVEHLFGNVLGVNAVDGIADVLLGRHDEREGEHAGRRHAVVESKHPRVDVDVRDAEEAAQLAENLQHLLAESSHVVQSENCLCVILRKFF